MHEAVPVHAQRAHMPMPKVQAAGPTPALFLAGCWINHISLEAPSGTGTFSQQWQKTLWLSILSSRLQIPICPSTSPCCASQVSPGKEAQGQPPLS